jgi:hypothetical protein
MLSPNLSLFLYVASTGRANIPPGGQPQPALNDSPRAPQQILSPWTPTAVSQKNSP